LSFNNWQDWLDFISNEAGPQTGKAKEVLRHSVVPRAALPL